MKQKIKKHFIGIGEYLFGIKQVMELIRISNLPPSRIIVPILLILLTSGLEGFSFALLAPLLDLFLGTANLNTNKIVHVYNTYIGSGDLQNPEFYIVIAISLFLSVWLLKGVTHFFSRVLSVRFVLELVSQLRQRIFDRYLSFGVQYYETVGMGKMKHAVIAYPQRVSSNLNAIVGITYALISLFVYLAVLFYMSWKTTLIMLAIMPIIAPVGRYVRTAIADRASKTNTAEETLSGHIIDSLSCITLIKATGTEKEESKKFAKLLKNQVVASMSAESRREMLQPIVEGGAVLSIAFLILFTSLVRGYTDTIVPTTLLVYMVIYRRALGMLTMTVTARGDIEMVAPQIRGIEYILEHDTDKFLIQDGEKEIHSLKTGIEINDLNFKYRKDTPTLKNISTLFKSGETTAIVGPSGAGKSTLVKVMLRFYEAKKGSVLIDGQDISEYKLESLRNLISYVSQDIIILNSTLKNNLYYGVESQSRDPEKLQLALAQAKLEEFVSRLPEGLETAVGDRGVLLSNGERQRVSIARAILKDSPVLFMDEATSALDTKTEKEIQSAIDDILSTRTAIVIAHRLSTIKDADKIIMIRNGTIAEEGTLKELLDKNGYFAEFWRAQSLGHAA